jgi:hypothetical protein
MLIPWNGAMTSHNRKRTCRKTGKECPQTQGRFGRNAESTAIRDTKARKDAIPHERGLSPVPPSDFCCTAIADPKALFAARRLPIDIHQPEK